MAKKSSPVDAAIHDADSEATGKRSRTKREVVYTAVPAGTPVEKHTMPGADWSEAQAYEALRAKLGADCLIEGPFYNVKGQNADTDTISVKIQLRDLRPSTKQYEGTYAGWKFFATGIKKCTVNGEQFADNDLLNIDFEGLVDENDKRPKPRFGRNAMIRRVSLEDCSEAAS